MFNADAWRVLLEPFGYDVDDRFYREMLVDNSMEEIHTCLLPITPWDDFTVLLKGRHQSLENCIAVARPMEGHSSPFPLHRGVVELLQSLPRSGTDRHFVYLLTNLPEDIVRKLLARTEEGAAMLNFFDHILVSSTSGQTYRNFVSNIRQGGEEADRPPKDSLFVSFETSAVGVKRAKTANIKAVGVALGAESAKTLLDAGACVTVNSFADLRAEYLPLMVAK
eukprot:GGOE01042848.1.p1 GENE.GGOE01042848.1~~GGOE01042848.1.p1  ORF type:complete len:223 (-),score=83.73 GGOE01042848.1:240-908(-)